MRVWDKFLTEQDKKVYEASGYGSRAGFAKRPAVVIVDYNNAFTGERDEPILDSIKKWKNSCGHVGWQAIAPTQRLLESVRANRIPVFYTTGIDPRPDGFDRGAWSFKNRRFKEDLKINTIVPGIKGKDIVADIAPLPSEFLIRKLKPSAFYGTPLPSFLVELGIDTLIMCGTTTSGCVRASVIDAFNLNYHITVVEECTFDRFESSHAISLFDMDAKYADVIGVDEVTQYLASTGPGLYDDKLAFDRVATIA